MFVAGKELRNWMGGVPAEVKRVNERPAQAEIHIALEAVSGNSVPLNVQAKSAQGGQLFVALFESGLTSEVKAGENRGATLQHDYVVREWIGPLAMGTDTQVAATHLQRTLSLPAGAVPKNLGVAAFVQSDKGEVLQALALPLCGS
jgi:hypothetical protein